MIIGVTLFGTCVTTRWIQSTTLQDTDDRILIDYHSGNVAAGGLGHHLANLRGLTLLDLGRLSLGCAGAAKIVAGLSQLPNLATLYLDRNHLHLGMMSTLADALAGLRSLRTLVLNRNAVGAVGAMQMGLVIVQMTQLEALHMRACQLREAAMRANTLSRLQALVHVDLRNNGFDELGIVTLRAAMTELSALTRARLSPQTSAPDLE